MKLGVIALNVLNLGFAEGLEFLQNLGVEAIEIGCAGAHDLGYCNPDELLQNAQGLRRWLDTFERHGIEISAFSAHGAPLSPDAAYAAEESRRFRQACRLAEAAGVSRITLVAGLPEGGPGDRTPCWAVTPFPAIHQEIRRWQWEERVLPYWSEHAKIAQEHGVRLCFEPQMSDVVHNPHELMRLRDELGPVVGCNFDPSHLMYQGIDVLDAIRYLGNAIYHVHVKDLRLQTNNLRIKGFLDPTPMHEVPRRSWSFALPGWGNDAQFWRSFVAELRLVGYEDVLSIEVEVDDVDMSEGVEKAVAFMKPLVLSKPPGKPWWEHARIEM